MKKRILSWLLVFCMTISTIYIIPYSASAATDDVITNEVTTASIEIGEYLQMGTYYGEPILWRCVDIDENGPLILSDKIICIKVYDAPGENIGASHGRAYWRPMNGSNYWGDSNIRCWLNSSASAGNVRWTCGNPPTKDKVINAYADEAGFKANFSQKELNVVKTVTQKTLLDENEYEKNGNNMYYRFRLNIDEAIQNYNDAYSEQVMDDFFLPDVKQVYRVYINSDMLGENYYIGEPTEQCKKNYAYDLTKTSWEWYYWLRTPGENGDSQCGDQAFCLEYGFDDCIVSTSELYRDGNKKGYIGVRPAFYLNTPFTSFISGNGTENNPYTVEGNGAVQQASFTLPSTLTVSLEDMPQMLYARGKTGITFTCNNNDVVELVSSNQKDIFETADVSGVYVKGLTPGTATITAMAPDGTSAQCLVTVEGKMAETIDDELILKAKICANNHSYKYMRDCWKSPSTVITENADLGTSKIYQGINDFIDACNLDYSVKNYYEIALMDMLNNKNIYYEVAKDATNNPFLKQAFSEANKNLKENANANKVTISGLNYFDVDKFYNDLTFLEGILLAGDVSSSMYEKYEQIYQLTLVTDKQIKALEAIKASTLNDDLKQACDTVIKSQAQAAQVTANEIAANTAFAGVEELGDFVVQRGWDELTNLIPGMAPAKAIVSAGKLVSNGIYNADKLSTDMLTMAATAEIEASLQETMKIYENKFLKNQTIDNALNFMATADFCKQIGVYGCDAAIEYAEDIEYSANIQEAINKASEIIPSMALKTLADLNKIIGKCDTENIAEFKRLAESIKRMTANYDFYDPCGDDIASYIRDVVSTTPSEWAKPYIDKAISYKLLDTEYQNNYQNNITRAEFCTLLTYLIENKSDISIEELAERAGRPAITVEFDDTMYVFVSEIAKLGIINGVGGNQFEPLGNITREQAAKMLCETARVLGYDITAPQTDLSGVSGWAKEGVNFVVDRDIMTGTNNGFEPQGTYTKEQAITTMVRIFENLK